jgi:hypothetical protein
MHEDLEVQIEDLRYDVQTLRTMIDVALDRGTSADDTFIRACANVLHERRLRLEELERVKLDADAADAPAHQ